jgi:phosphoribosyl-AMP cyclohydrolase / phosphoribosyl-ATP pyrophosphohydrolase
MPADITAPFTLDSITFDAHGLVPVIAQEVGSGRVLMLAHANREAIQKTLETKLATYWSRSRNKLWTKGEESGHTQRIQSITLDCDGDAVLYAVEQTGAACHTGAASCFHNVLEGESQGSNIGDVLGNMYATILDRIRNQPEGSYVAKLHNSGLDRILKKIGEEAGEVIIAAKNGSRPELQLEVADLLFHTMLTMAEVGVNLSDIAGELEGRYGKRRE